MTSAAPPAPPVPTTPPGLTGADTPSAPARVRGDWWMTVWLAGAYLITSVVLIYQSLGPGTTGANDVRLYAWWMQQGELTGGWLGIDSSWVYPVGALVPLLLSSVLGTGTAYLAVWCAMVALINLGTAVVVVRHFGVARAAGPLVGWFVFLMLLGPCGIARLDAVMMPLVLMALVVASARPALASVLLTCGAWIKVSAGAVLIPLVAVVRPWREQLLRVVAPAGLTCVAVVGLQQAAGGQWRFLTSFVETETDRGLQIEAVLATPVVLGHAFKGEQLWAWNDVLSTSETWGPGAELAVKISDVAMPLMALAVGVLVWLARHRPTAALLTGTLAMMSGLIVTHKVGSPQFVAWLAPAAVVALCFERRLRFWLPVGIALLVTAALTGWLYPWGYIPFLGGDRLMLAVWVVRNLLLVGVFVFALVELVRLWRSTRLETGGSPAAGGSSIDGANAGGANGDGSKVDAAAGFGLAVDRGSAPNSDEAEAADVVDADDVPGVPDEAVSAHDGGNAGAGVDSVPDSSSKAQGSGKSRATSGGGGGIRTPEGDQHPQPA